MEIAGSYKMSSMSLNSIIILFLFWQLFSEILYVTLESNKWKVTKESLLISRVSKLDSLYLVETLNEVGAICYGSMKQ